MDELVNSLTALGFTATEAKVYLILVRDGEGTGDQVARSLGLARSSVYAALDGLFAAGAVFLRDEESSIYTAKDPDQLISERKKAYNENADDLKEKLESLGEDQKSSSSFYNVGSLEAILQKAVEILDNAGRAVYINTDFNLSSLEQPIREAADRGVRILLFSFHNFSLGDLPVEYYRRKYTSEVPCESHRLMITSDREQTLVAGGSGSSYRGVFTENPLMSRIVAEHIHLDIYIQKAGRGFEKRIESGELLLGTPHESRL